MSTKIRVMICDDHSLFRAGIKASLAYKNDITIVGEAVDGMDLLNKLNYTETDIILLDINMPRMDGMAVLPVLKSNEKYKDIKVIILSMHNQMSMISKMMSLGANSYLTKSDDCEMIYEAIVSCYHKDYYFNDLTNKSLLNTIKKNQMVFMEEDSSVEDRNQKVQINNESDKNNKQSKFNIFNNIFVRGILMGVISLGVIFILLYLYKTLNNNLNLLNFTP
jgi:DNA-binding NarL/FixJ family response regulator